VAEDRGFMPLLEYWAEQVSAIAGRPVSVDELADLMASIPDVECPDCGEVVSDAEWPEHSCDG